MSARNTSNSSEAEKEWNQFIYQSDSNLLIPPSLGLFFPNPENYEPIKDFIPETFDKIEMPSKWEDFENYDSQNELEEDFLTCNLCARPILSSQASSHLEACVGKESSEPKKKKALQDIALPSPKSTVASSRPRLKAVNLDKHCGVPTGPLLEPCTRVLTCKGHSIKLKRQVKGRSKPFDQLLSRTQRKKSGNFFSLTESHNFRLIRYILQRNRVCEPSFCSD